MKRFFCKVFGHTWVAATSNPKTSWNVDKTGQLLVPTRSGELRFYHECVRCRERRELLPPRRG
jgi:hypothetical protein